MLSTVVMAKDQSSFMEEEAFLEFMGSWETSDGQWISPDEIEKLDIPEDKRGKESQAEAVKPDTYEVQEHVKDSEMDE